MIAPTRVRDRFALLLVALLPLQACSDSSAPPVAATVAISGALPASATVNTSITPSVIVSDDGGRPIRGASVTFQALGGGSVANASATTNSSGIATPGGWTMSTTSGQNSLRATSGPATQTFNVEAVASNPAAIAPAENNVMTAAINSLISVAPAARVTDQFGNPVRNVVVTFTPQAGSGTITGNTAVTGEDGTARPGTWTLGPIAGEQRLTATAVGLTTTIVVLAIAPPFAKFAGDLTTCPVNTTQCLFTVVAATETGGPMVGQQVAWSTPEGATLTTTTNAKGRSTVPNLTARATPGPGAQTARMLSTGDEVTFNFTVVAGGGYNLDVRFVGDIPASQLAIFQSAAARWEKVITGDLQPLDIPAGVITAGVCSNIKHPAFEGVIDDLLIYIVVDSIDGPGGTLGRAGPCFIRSSNALPVFGVMELDRDDLAALEVNGTLFDVIVHEIGHVIGFGTMWPEFGLITGSGGSDPFFTGARAISGFQLAGGTLLNGVPIENTGGPGTRDGHWRETTFSRELMTGFVSNPPNPLSATTIASFMDMGYQVNFGEADNYTVVGGIAGLRAGEQLMQAPPHTEPLERPSRLPTR